MTVALERLARAGVDVADRRADLGVGVGREVLHQEVDEPSVPLQEREQLGGAVPGVRRRWRRRSHRLRHPHQRRLHIVRQLAAAEDREPGAEGERQTLAERDHPPIVSRCGAGGATSGRQVGWTGSEVRGVRQVLVRRFSGSPSLPPARDEPRNPKTPNLTNHPNRSNLTVEPPNHRTFRTDRVLYTKARYI